MLEKVTRKIIGSPSSKIFKTQLDKVQDPDLIAPATEQKTHHLRTSLPTSVCIILMLRCYRIL